MSFLAALASLFGTVLTPAALFLCSAGIVSRTEIGKILDMKPLFLREKGRRNRQSPLSALSLALAGTLGVGNITGVASALTAGGPGAVFWMWAGAAAVIPVKYAEVRLALRYRIRSGEGWTGGAMYTIRDGLGGAVKTDRGRRFVYALASFFAVLCALNALVTGNLVQANAAVSLFGGNRLIAGAVLSLLVALSAAFGTRRIEKLAARMMPPLTLFYIGAALFAILPRARLLPSLIGEIFS
ncbi:MAG: alanine:cation symporter family protein, partial [Clostridia bacterium]|nr:alanine:cation symporter family protein [Clostridia bacterium]